MTYKHKRRVQIKSSVMTTAFSSQTLLPHAKKMINHCWVLSEWKSAYDISSVLKFETSLYSLAVHLVYGLEEIVAVPWVPGKQHFGTILLLTFCGIRAFAVPFLFPVPVWRPFLRARVFFLHRAREWTATGLRIIKPSFMSLRTFCPEKTTTAS